MEAQKEKSTQDVGEEESMILRLKSDLPLRRKVASSGAG